MDPNEAIQKSDASFVIVPTPSDSTGFFSNRFVLQAMEIARQGPEDKKGYHMVIITSTVMPGTTGGEIKAALEAASGRKVGPDLGLCYNPEFIALGSVVRDMLFPDLDPDRRERHQGRRHAADHLPADVREEAAGAAHELRERRAHQDLGEHLRHHQDLLRQHAGRHLRPPAGRRRRRGDQGAGRRHPHRREVPARARWAMAAPASRATTWPSPLSPARSAPAPTWPRRPTASTTSRSSACRAWSPSSPRPARASPCWASPTSRRRRWWRKATA